MQCSGKPATATAPRNARQLLTDRREDHCTDWQFRLRPRQFDFKTSIKIGDLKLLWEDLDPEPRAVVESDNPKCV